MPGPIRRAPCREALSGAVIGVQVKGLCMNRKGDRPADRHAIPGVGPMSLAAPRLASHG